MDLVYDAVTHMACQHSDRHLKGIIHTWVMLSLFIRLMLIIFNQ